MKAKQFTGCKDYFLSFDFMKLKVCLIRPGSYPNKNMLYQYLRHRRQRPHLGRDYQQLRLIKETTLAVNLSVGYDMAFRLREDAFWYEQWHFPPIGKALQHPARLEYIYERNTFVYSCQPPCTNTYVMLKQYIIKNET